MPLSVPNISPARTTIFSLLTVIIFALIPLCSCTTNEDFANPLDPENLRTSGAPDRLKAQAGDKQVQVTWGHIDRDGIAEYRIYRRSVAGTEAEFELVGSIEAPATEFTDTQDLENDRRDTSGRILAYEYRITYVDLNGVETPDPANPPDPNEEPRREWVKVAATPSVPPPKPTVTLGDPTDLTVKLFWEEYTPPHDFSVFRIYAALDTQDHAPLHFNLLDEFERDQLYYFDRDFRADGIRKVYHIAAVDEFGVEGLTTITAMSPNIPPAPPQNVRVLYQRRSLFNTKYDVLITWTPNTEPDLAGYQLYTKDADGNLILRPAPGKNDRSWTISGEDPILVGQYLQFRPYYIAAFDNTPGIDGLPDESQLTEARPQ